MKYALLMLLASVCFFLAYQSAQKKLSTKTDLGLITLNISVKELEKRLGSPYQRDRSQLTYVMDDSSLLYVSLRDEKVTSAYLKFHSPLKIEDPHMRRLTLVQMSSSELDGDRPSWFFAGRPEEGHIYKITQQGEVESITWVPPFSYGDHQRKNLQALLRDFRSRHLKNM